MTTPFPPTRATQVRKWSYRRTPGTTSPYRVAPARVTQAMP